MKALNKKRLTKSPFARRLLEVARSPLSSPLSSVKNMAKKSIIFSISLSLLLGSYFNLRAGETKSSSTSNPNAKKTTAYSRYDLEFYRVAIFYSENSKNPIARDSVRIRLDMHILSIEAAIDGSYTRFYSKVLELFNKNKALSKVVVVIKEKLYEKEEKTKKLISEEQVSKLDFDRLEF